MRFNIRSILAYRYGETAASWTELRISRQCQLRSSVFMHEYVLTTLPTGLVHNEVASYFSLMTRESKLQLFLMRVAVKP